MQTILDSWKAEGYYLLVQTGRYKELPIKEYSVVRDLSDSERSIKCILNKAAAKIAEDYLPTAHAIKKCNWLTPPEQTLHYNFQNNKEPLKLTF